MKHTRKFLAIILILAMTLGLLAVPIPVSAAFCKDCDGAGTKLCFVCSGTGTKPDSTPCTIGTLGGDGYWRTSCNSCDGTGIVPCVWVPCTGDIDHDHTYFSGPIKPPHHKCLTDEGHYGPCEDTTGDGKCDDCGQTLALKCSLCKGTGWELCFWCAGTGDYFTCPGEHSNQRFSTTLTTCDQLKSDLVTWCHETLVMLPCNVHGCAYRANAGYYGDTCPKCNGTGEPSFADKLGSAAADADALLDAWLDDDIGISALMNTLIAADQDKALELLTKLSDIEDAFAEGYLAAKADDDVNAAFEALKEYYRAMVALIEEYFGVTAPEALKDAIAPTPTVCAVCGEYPCVCGDNPAVDKIFAFFDRWLPTWLAKALTWITRYVLFGWLWEDRL